MNSSFKTKASIAEILPGAFVVAWFIYSYLKAKGYTLDSFLHKDSGSLLVLTGFAFLASWIIGNFLDAIRNGIVEENLDDWCEVNWDFFFYERPEKVSQFVEYYYDYYKLDVNFILAALLGFVIEILLSRLTLITVFILFIMIIVFFFDAKSLRHEIKRLLQEQDWKERYEKGKNSASS